MSAVPLPSFLAATCVVDHPWVAAARVEPRLLASGFGEPLVRVVPTVAGLEELRAHGKAHLVDVLRSSFTELPSQPRAWRIVDDLHDAQIDKSDQYDRPRIRSVHVVSGAEMESTLFVPYDLRVFEGHFSFVPLLPGALQIAWALDLAQAHLAHVGRFCGITAVKFRRLVRPGTELRLAMQWSAPSRELRFEYRDATQTASCGRLQVAAADD